MTDQEFKEIADQIWKIIQKSQNILMHLHPSPDPDSAGSALAMYWMLKGISKNPTIIKGDSEIPNWLQYLPGGDQVIAKNFTEVNLSDFDNYIALDTGGLSQITKKAEIVFPSHLHTILIDHHAGNSGFAQVNLLDFSSPATTQIIFKLFKYWSININENIAANLLAGLYMDTGGFKYSPTTFFTFEIAAELAKVYPQYTKTIFDLENNNSLGQIKYRALALNNIHSYGRFAIAELPYDMLLANGISKSDTETTEIANEIKSVIDWNMGITFVEMDPDIIRVSLRTRDEYKYDVSKIARATGFGGGHRAAAGATLKMPFEQAKKFLIDTIYSVYPELNTQAVY